MTTTRDLSKCRERVVKAVYELARDEDIRYRLKRMRKHFANLTADEFPEDLRPSFTFVANQLRVDGFDNLMGKTMKETEGVAREVVNLLVGLMRSE